MKHMKKLLILALTLSLLLIVLPMNAAAETVTETTGWVYDYMTPSGYNLQPLELDRECTMRIDFECTYPYPSLFVDRGRERMEADSFFRTSNPDDSYGYIYGFYAKYTLEPGTYNIFFFPESVYSDSGAFGFKITLSYEAHTHDYEYDRDVKPTCSERGYTEYTCSCGDSYKEYYGQKLPHTEAASAEVAPTCQSTGRTAGTYCSVCGTTISGRETIPKIDHVYVDNVCTYCGRMIGTCGDNLEWAFEIEGSLTITGSGEMYDYEPNGGPWYSIRDKVKTVKLSSDMTSIGDYAFQGLAHNEIKIYSNIKSVGKGAFEGCEKLARVTLSDGLKTIGESAFHGCSALRTIDIPNSVEVIGSYAFADCNYLCNAYMSNSLTELSPHLFENCNNLDTLIVPASVTKIGEDVLKNCSSLRKLEFPDDITSLPDNLLSGCTNLKTVTLPKNLTAIPDGFFSGCAKLTTVTMPSNITAIPDSCFSGCAALTSITIPSGVTTIGNRAFSDCAALASITIPDGVTSIGNRAFSGCAALAKINIPEGITSIEDYTFSNCAALTELFIPETVASIGRQAFSGCTGMTKMTIAGDAPVIGKGAFKNMAAAIHYDDAASGWEAVVTQSYGGSITWDTEHTYKSEVTDYTCTEQGYATHTCICGNVLIDSYTDAAHRWYRFSSVNATEETEGELTWKCKQCGELNTEVIPKLEHVHKYTSKKTNPTCTEQGYTTHTCPCGDSYTDQYKDPTGHNISGDYCSSCAKVGKCGDNLFWEYDDTTDTLTISGTGKMYKYQTSGYRPTWELLSDNVFKNVIIEEGVTTVGDFAFFSKSFETLVLPESLTSIGERAFINNKDLQKVTIPAGVTSCGKMAFRGCTSLKEATIYCPTVSQQMFESCDNLANVVLAEGVTTLKSSAFAYCTSLTEINLPSSLRRMEGTYSDQYTSYDYGVFYGCSALKEITIPAGVTHIGPAMFLGCTSLKNIYFQCSGCLTKSSYQEDFAGVTANAYYPEHDSSWNTVIKKKWGGKLKWIPYAPCTGHVFGEWVREVEPTCTKSGYETHACEICGYVETQMVNATGHSWDDGVVTDATCLKDGYTTVTCTACRESYQDAVTNATGHTWDEGVITAPTCTEKGYTTYTCHCGETYQDHKVDMIEHTWDKGTVTKEPTEEATGTMRYACTACGKTKDETIPNLEHTHKYTTKTTLHTCTEKGYTTYTCKCGDTYQDNFVDAPGHKWNDGVITKEPTEEAEGQKLVTCTVCDESETQPIPKLEHVHKYDSVVTDPSCTEKGYTTYTCRCGDSYVADEVPTLGHAMSDWTVIDATCTESGSKTRTCSRCGEVETEVIAALNHDLAVETQNPTCTADGLKVTTCTRCDYSTTEILPATGHSHKAVVTAPTCTEGGYTTHTCHCGDSYTDSETAALDHDVAYAVETAPTLEAEGVLVGTCTRCAKTSKIVLPKLSKTAYALEVITEPTKEAEGLGKYTWNVTDYGTFTFEAAIPNTLLGDVNDDGTVGIADLMRLANHFAKGVEINKANADVNADGTVTIADLMRLANFFAGKAQLG